MRTVTSAPGSLELEDIAPDGRVLLAHGSRRPSVMALAPGAAEESELTWMDFSWVADIPPTAGRSCSASRAWPAARATPCTCAAWTGRRRCVSARAWRFALARRAMGARHRPGARTRCWCCQPAPASLRVLPPHAIKAFSWAGWFPDGKRILVAGFEEGKGQRVYVQDLSGGAPRPVTPEGVAERANTFTPDGKWIAARVQGSLMQFPVDGGEPQPMKGAEPEDRPLRWRGDGRVLFVRQGRLPARIFALDVDVGPADARARDRPRDTVRRRSRARHRLTPDGKSYAYVYIRSLSGLYQVTGLK